MAGMSITIVLELDEEADCPVGSARLPDGSRHPFHGWLGLAEAIDALTGIAASSSASTTLADECAGQHTERSNS